MLDEGIGWLGPSPEGRPHEETSMILGQVAYPMLAINLSTWHIVIFVLVVLLLFGGKKLPELAKGMARGMRIFRDELHGMRRDIEEPPADMSQPPAPTEPKDTPKA
jgi:sec-independent protein translocase protein TatA